MCSCELIKKNNIMEEQKLKELIEKAINKGWLFYGEFSTSVATESILKLLKEQLHIPVVALQSEQLCIKCKEAPAKKKFK